VPYEDVAALVAVIDLEDIYCIEERGRRIEWSEEELQSRTFPETSNSMGVSVDANRVRYRFRSIYSDVAAEYVADWEALFILPEGEELVAGELTQQFAEKVAFFAVYPYLRASIYGSASRLNQAVPVLGIVRQGQFASGANMTEAEVKEAFLDNKSERVAE
jgi:hypothetical protein